MRTGVSGSESERLFRLGCFDGVEVCAFRNANTFQLEHTAGPDRVCICAETDHLGLLRKLAFLSLIQPVFVLYVLHTSRCNNVLGRYQSPPLSFDSVNLFMHEFGEFLSQDGRHDLWLHSPESNATLVWDRHNFIYGYGPLDQFREILKGEGLQEDAVAQLPIPHIHMYHQKYDDAEARILHHLQWTLTPLSPEEVQFSDDPATGS
jgi:hypothetical protein